jgi:hypothetical protein
MPALENAHALIVGIANYQKINPLPATVLKDAQDIHNLLVSPNYCGYLADNVQLLLDSQATQTNLRQALGTLAQNSNAESSVLLYISSHGGQVEFGPHAGEYLLPVDADCTSGTSLAQTAIAGSDFTDALRAISARKLVVLFDCCHAGGIGQPKDANAPVLKGGLSDNYYDRLKQGTGRAILASSRSTESSYVLPDASNSLFTQHLLAGLQGGIASDDGLIRIFDLFEYVQPKVTSEQPNQHPIFKAELEENFPLALYLGGQKGVIPKVEAGFRYDAYISYVDAEPDATWVWDTLLPRLEQAGLRVVVSDDVQQSGVDRVVSIPRGIKQAKRTVVVLSKAYLTDNWLRFEEVMAETIGIEEGSYRILPVKIESLNENQIPDHIKRMVLKDLTNPSRFERRFNNLIQELKEPLPRI